MSATVKSAPEDPGAVAELRLEDVEVALEAAPRDRRRVRLLAVRACGQKTGRRKLGCSVVLPHSAHMSTGARATGSSGQNGKRPWRAAR